MKSEVHVCNVKDGDKALIKCVWDLLSEDEVIAYKRAKPEEIK
jgi:hypothetical protein